MSVRTLTVPLMKYHSRTWEIETDKTPSHTYNEIETTAAVLENSTKRIIILLCRAFILYISKYLLKRKCIISGCQLCVPAYTSIKFSSAVKITFTPRCSKMNELNVYDLWARVRTTNRSSSQNLRLYYLHAGTFRVNVQNIKCKFVLCHWS